MQKAIVLINLGTPANLTKYAVSDFLEEFLLDPFVIDIPWFFRQLLVRGIIVPFRTKKSLYAYIQIWIKAGSPLLVNTINLAKKLNAQMEEDVYFCMRYGQPSIKNCIKHLVNKKYDQIIVVPLYPQYALSSTQTAIVEFEKCAKQLKLQSEVKFVEAFYNQPGFIDPLTEKIRKGSIGYDHVLFSYHGLPKKHLTKLDSTGKCTIADCCINPGERINKCYRAQCYATTNLVVSQLESLKDRHSIAFQSRLGSGWIKPFTDFEIPKLAKQGVKKLAVVCPSFVADCLETLEEIEIRARNSFIAAGGEDLKLILSLNDDDEWVMGLKTIIESSKV